MEEQEFLSRLTESVRYGDYSKMDELLNLLKVCEITFDKTTDFAKKHNQYWEYVELRVPIPLVKEANIHKDYLIKLCNDIYIKTAQYDFGGLIIKVGKIKYEMPEEKLQEIHFEEIQKQILEQIKLAKYTIWIAVAWFTDESLFNELLNKKKQGVNVQVIVIDDDINRNYGFKYEEYFEAYKIKKSGYFENIMHNKFCIIDLKTVIHGSYNWTKKAQYNKETISIDTDRAIAEKFTDEFIKLKISK